MQGGIVMLCYVFVLLFICFFHFLFFLLFIFLFSLFTFLPCAWVIQQLILPVSLSSQTFPLPHFPQVSLLSSFCVTSFKNRWFHLDLSFPVGHFPSFSCWKPLLRFYLLLFVQHSHTILFYYLSSNVIVFKFCDIFISYSLLLFHFICLNFPSQLLPFYQYVPCSMPMFLLHTLITGI